ncbi:hypothetical protein X12_004524 (plasmid) [Xanthomonas arboricola]|uniref:hypothetical protein n=1 Tax=Xanthomonas arboricola TaxID=56448 RepID=UPI002B31B3D8|nr:hypothetical protein X12_004524 [Xanthomonas arboricola]
MVRITDPETVALLESYRQFLGQVDEVSGSLDDVTQGLVLGLLDEHARFREWRRGTCTEAS